VSGTLTRGIAAVGFGVGLTLLACGSDDIVLANIPSEDGGRTPPQLRCVTEDDCPSGFFCGKQTCDSPAGSCESFPGRCSDEMSAVCGCDGITYFNNCLRRAAGVASSQPGPCPLGSAPCKSSVHCPPPSKCARLLGACSQDPVGSCWVIPATCGSSPEDDGWIACGEGSGCLNTCNAIRSGKTYRASTCP
jgi:hypothetical protein